MIRRSQPWKRGPAELIPFPVKPVRWWHVLPITGRPGVFRGVLFGMVSSNYEGPTTTEDGPADLVVSTLCSRRLRRGLPIVVGGAA